MTSNINILVLLSSLFFINIKYVYGISIESGYIKCYVDTICIFRENDFFSCLNIKNHDNFGFNNCENSNEIYKYIDLILQKEVNINDKKKISCLTKILERSGLQGKCIL